MFLMQIFGAENYGMEILMFRKELEIFIGFASFVNFEIFFGDS